MHSPLLPHGVNPTSFYVLLAKHPIRGFQFSLAESIFIDVLGILVLVLLRLLLSILTDGDRVAHAQNLSKLRALVLDPMQIEGELSTISAVIGRLILLTNGVIIGS